MIRIELKCVECKKKFDHFVHKNTHAKKFCQDCIDAKNRVRQREMKRKKFGWKPRVLA